MKKSEIRKHYFLDRYVIFSPKRNLRPVKVAENENAKLKESCFFCPKELAEPIKYKVGKGKNWEVAVVPNKFPALTTSNKKAYGVQEVIIDTPKHGKELSDLSVEHIAKLLQVYDNRMDELAKDEKIKYVAVFKNEGGRAGASVAHSHSQVYALPMIPPEVQSTSDAIDNYFLEHKSCPFCDIIKKERKEKVRIAYETSGFVALCPYSSSSAYGVWILPKKHKREIQDLNKKELRSLAKVLKYITKKLDDADMAYNLFIHNSLDNENHHFRLKIVPRTNIWAGLELSSGIIINPVFPEDAAAFYRK